MLILTAVAAEQWDSANSSLQELGEIIRDHPIRDSFFETCMAALERGLICGIVNSWR